MCSKPAGTAAERGLEPPLLRLNFAHGDCIGDVTPKSAMSKRKVPGSAEVCAILGGSRRHLLAHWHSAPRSCRQTTTSLVLSSLTKDQSSGDEAPETPVQHWGQGQMAGGGPRGPREPWGFVPEPCAGLGGQLRPRDRQTEGSRERQRENSQPPATGGRRALWAHGGLWATLPGLVPATDGHN